MSTQKDQIEIENDSVQQQTEITDETFDRIADQICLVWVERKERRKDRERQWADIDRQLRMEPKNPHKLKPNGRLDLNKVWMSEMELPLQTQTHEVLTADARRLMLPDTGNWYECIVELSDEYTERLQGFGVDVTGEIQIDGEPAAKMAGDENDLLSSFLQRQANQLVEGIQDYYRSQYDFGASLDGINAESFKYGEGIGRGRLVKKPQIMNLALGDASKEIKFPALIPVSIKNTYLDDSPHATMHEGIFIDGGVIQHREVLLDDLKIASDRGSSDSNSLDGGWMEIRGIDSKDKRGLVDLLEFEGDLVVPMGAKSSIVQRGVLVTVIVGKQGRKQAKRVIRFRFRKTPFNSYLEFPYHVEDITDRYASSPLMKGRVVQMSAVDALNRLLDSAALKNAPPIGYDRTDMYFAQQGGPEICPHAQWATVSELNVYDEVGGDPAAIAGVFTNLVQLYYDVTGVQQPRLGQQTVSHTTAFAKNAELQRGVVRTVDYVKNSLKGPLTRWLYMERFLLNETLTASRQPVFIPGFSSWMEVSKGALPDRVWYNALGADEPIREEQKRQGRIAAAQQALQIDLLRIQTGQQPILSTEKMIDAILSEGGWTDIDSIKSEPAVLSGQSANDAAGAEGATTALPAGVQAQGQTALRSL